MTTEMFQGIDEAGGSCEGENECNTNHHARGMHNDA